MKYISLFLNVSMNNAYPFNFVKKVTCDYYGLSSYDSKTFIVNRME